jgi:hypothetical protein
LSFIIAKRQVLCKEKARALAKRAPIRYNIGIVVKREGCFMGKLFVVCGPSGAGFWFYDLKSRKAMRESGELLNHG